MRRLALRISVSIDGFIAGPNGEVDWMAKSRSPAGSAWVADKIGQAGAHLFGRKSFSEIAPFWSTAKGSLADAMNSIPKVVFSKKGFEASKMAGAAKSWTRIACSDGRFDRRNRKIKTATGEYSCRPRRHKLRAKLSTDGVD